MLLLLVACIENKLNAPEEEVVFDSGDSPPEDTEPVEETAAPPTAPDIEVSPTNLVFDWLAPGEADAQVFTVRNVGDAVLTVASMDWSRPDAVFTLTAPALPAALDPAESLEVTVTYTSADADGHSGELLVGSDDVDEPSVPVEVAAQACESGSGAPSPFLVSPSADGRIELLPSVGDGTFGASVKLGEVSANAWTGFVVGDFNGGSGGDGSLDLVARSATEGDLYLYTWDRCTEAWVAALLESAPAWTPEGAADLDADGVLDLYGFTDGDRAGVVALGLGDGTFVRVAAPFDTSASYSGYGFKAVYHASDLDGDGAVDLLTADYDGVGDDVSGLWRYLGLGDGTFAAPERIGDIPTPVNGVDAADLDGDGDVDLLAGLDDDGDAGNIFVLWGDAGDFSTAELWDDAAPAEESGSNNPGAGRLKLWDFDGDGVVEVYSTFEIDPYASPRSYWVEQRLVAADGTVSAVRRVEEVGQRPTFEFALPVAGP